MDKQKQVATTIREYYSEIFSAEKRVADFILKHPEIAVNLNVAKLAKKSGVSDATVVRFCKHIGYSGYYELRINLSRDLGHRQAAHAQEKGEDFSDLFEVFAKKLRVVGNNLTTTLLSETAELIHASNHIHIVAVGNTVPLSMYMGFLLGRMQIRCTYNVVPEYFLNHINLAGKGDTIIAISKSGESKAVLQALKLAKARNMQSIVITAYGDSPCGRLADNLLVSASQEEAFNVRKSYFHLNEMAVIDALLYHVLELLDSDTDMDEPEIMLSGTKL